MADKTISIGFKIEDDGKGLKQLTLDAESFKRAISSSASETDKLGKKMVNFAAWGANLTNLKNSFQGLQTTLNNLTAESRGFTDAMRATNTMAGKGAQDFEKLKAQVTDLCKTVPVAREALAEGLYQVISNGVPEDNWLSFLEASARSSVGGIADLGKTVGVTSTVIKNYGLEWSAAADIQDKIQLTAKNGVTSFEQMAEALPRVAGQAATLGVSIDELMASFATLTGVSGNTAEVSTQLAAIFSALVKPASKASKIAEEMGIQFDAAAIKAAGGFSNFLTQLDADIKDYASKHGMLEQEIYGRLFKSAESLRALIPLTGELKDKFGENIEAMKGSAGTMDAAFEDMSKTGEAKSQALKNSFVDLYDTLNGFIAPVKPWINYGVAILGVAANVGVLATSMTALKTAFAGSFLVTMTKQLGFLTTATGIQTVKTHGLSAAMKTAATSANTATLALRGMMAATVVGAAVAAAFWGVQKAIEACKNSADEAASAQKTLNEVHAEAGRKVAEETVKIQLLIAAAKDETSSMEARKKACQELNGIIPDYNAQIDATTGKYKASTDALDKYIKKLQQLAIVEGAKEKLKALGAELADLKAKEMTAKKDFEHEQAQSIDSTNFTGAGFGNDFSAQAREVSNKGAAKSRYEEAQRASQKKQSQIDAVTQAVMPDYQAAHWGGVPWASGMGPDTHEAETSVGPAVSSSGGASSGSGKGKTRSASKTDTPAPAGSLQSLQDEKSALEKKIKVTTDANELEKLTADLAALDARINIRLDYQKDYDKIKQEMSKGLSMPEIPDLVVKADMDISKFRKAGIKIPQYIDNVRKQNDQAWTKQQEKANNTAAGIQGSFALAANTMKLLAGVTDDNTAAWANFAATTISGIAEILPQLAALISGKFAAAMATGTESGAKLPFPANIAAIASIVGTIVSVMASIPKFAEGGIAYGPTLGLFGEYAGASNNPEVVAPLDRLKSLIGDTGRSGNVYVTGSLKAKGSELVAVLRNVTQADARSGKRSGIAIG